MNETLNVNVMASTPCKLTEQVPMRSPTLLPMLNKGEQNPKSTSRVNLSLNLMAAVPVTINPVRIAPDAFPVKEKEGIRSLAGKSSFIDNGLVETSMTKCQPNPHDSVLNAVSVHTAFHMNVDLTVNGSDVQTCGADLGSGCCCFGMVANR
ncbi:hypothetical protein CPB85DRAFT_1346767 [Mucidula mucida]|nr:hypothetical protein CPB85DRAFT_1346767 [Mucidula mucida]